MPEPDNNDPVTNSTAATANASRKDIADLVPVGGDKAPVPDAAAQAGAVGQPDLTVQLAAAKAEAAANFDRFMRAMADLENFRRRSVRERDELRATVTGRVFEDIFPVLDNLALALAAAKQSEVDVKSLVGGVEMVLAQLKSALASHGLKEIVPVGQPFDPHQHEAISHQPSADVKEEHVLTVIRTGYSLNGRLLRPASVVVSSGPAKPVGK
ncbi:MAG: nucleotide exchange factor GrpE [Verrucomicrobia bacterium]|nr:nucleotide exchange factor GrpE [Verrucomicrobiota bacterium]